MPAQRLEIWTDYQCAGGTRKGFLPLSAVVECTILERTTREDEGMCTVSKESDAYTQATVGSVLRILAADGSFEEWRIQRVDDESRRARIATLRLRSPLMELGTSNALLSETVGGVLNVGLEWKALTPASILALIIPFCPSWWTAGTVTPTIPCDLSPNAWMPLQALRELIAAIRGQGVDAELTFRRNGTTGYFIDIVSTIGSSATALDVRTGKNLLSTTRSQDRDRYAVEVVPLGTGSPRATMAKAFIEVTAKAGAVLTVAQPVTGGAIVAFDNQWNNLYLIDDTGARQLISACVGGATQTITVASGTNFTVGRWYRAAVNSSGDELLRLRKIESTSGVIQKVESSVLGSNTNFVGNPAMRIWTGGAGTAPDNWTKSGTGTFTKTTTTGLWKYGGQSCRCQQAGVAISLQSPRIAFYVPTWATNVQFSCWVYIVAYGSGPQLTWRRDAATDMGITAIGTLALNTWQRVDANFSLSGLTAAVHDFSIIYSQSIIGGTSDIYIDSAQVTLSAAADVFMEGSQATRLLALANRYLTKFSTTPVAYRFSFADVGDYDATGFPFDGVTLGQTVNVRDTDLNSTASARLLERTRNIKNPLAAELVVSSRPDDLASLLTGIPA